MLLSACAYTDRADMAAGGDFEILDQPKPGTAPYDYRIACRTKINTAYDLQKA